MSAEDWIPDFDEDEAREWQEVRCKFCGERDLSWVYGQLVDGKSVPHRCQRNAPKLTDFPITK